VKTVKGWILVFEKGGNATILPYHTAGTSTSSSSPIPLKKSVNVSCMTTAVAEGSGISPKK